MIIFYYAKGNHMKYFFICCLILALSAAAFAETVKVRLFSLDTLNQVSIISSAGKRLDINTYNSPDFKPLSLINDTYEVIAANKKRVYKGSLDVTKPDSGFILILNCDLEDYTQGVLWGEADFENYHKESTKALAVLARTYAVTHKKRHASYDVCDTSHCQQFRGIIKGRFDIESAVKETKGLILNSKEVYYSKCCGGLIDEPQSVWAGKKGKVIKDSGKKEDYCAAYKYYRWEKHVKKWEITDTLRAFSSTAEAEIMLISRTTPSGRAYEFTFGATDGFKIKAEDFLSEFGKKYNWARIPSRPYQIVRRGDEFIFMGFGQGHGCGMCVYGASVMAKNGHNYMDILRHYFPDTGVIKHN